MSSNVPSVRTTPPSEPTNAIFELRGSKTIACWSGCICSYWCLPGWSAPSVSAVMSVQDTPAFVERMTARPLERHGAMPASELSCSGRISS